MIVQRTKKGRAEMTDTEQRLAAKQFIKNWTGHGDEKQETQSFWLAFLRDVFGVEKPENMIKFEVPVKLSHTSFIDGYIESTHVLIEQKGIDIDLRKGYKQSDGAMMTPFQQARRYAGNLPHNMNPRWIIVCNFREFHIHDMNHPNDTPEVILLQDLEKECHRFKFLIDTGSELNKKEMEVSLKAGALVGKLYDALLKQYNSPASDAELKSLNMLCVRLVFCLYAEDAGIFGSHTMFHDYLKGFQPKNVRKALIDLFRVLNMNDAERKQYDPYMDEELAAFPYTNGGLFADDSIIIPHFTEEIIDLLLTKASEDFNWSSISPTIFGAVFESTLNPETRRSGGMHYTSIENIHKVIDPLFLNELTQELDTIAEIGVTKTRNAKLEEFQNKLASLTFLDPACGSGNFLTETYLSLRRLENKAVALRMGDQIVLGEAEFDPIKVKINQFYGIEINDFAVTVAQAALWIAESQMMQETTKIVRTQMDFLPLTSRANIVEGNALRLNWEEIVPKDKLNYIMGNPPFVGARLMGQAQKDDVNTIFYGWKNAGNLDYVACWYKKAADMMSDSSIRAALVSTNSICQGETVAILWQRLFDVGLHIDFAHRTFRWDSEAKLKAHVHCVIVGFSIAPNKKPKLLYSGDNFVIANSINGYLLDAPSVFIQNLAYPICDVPKMDFGSMPNDGGYLSDYSTEEKEAIVKQYPQAKSLFRKILGATEFINNKERWCIWLEGISPSIIKTVPPIYEAVNNVRTLRENSSREATRKLANAPMLFGEIRQPATDYLLVPSTSSERRKYIPIGFIPNNVISNNANLVVPDATLYHFGMLTSNVHNAWMRAVCGRLKSDYRYSVKIVYNNFPWPNPTDAQKAKIEQTAQAILDARALYPDCSLADLYDEVTMPPELRKAHQQNDKAVMEAYGFWGKLNTETECVAELMKMYQELTK